MPCSVKLRRRNTRRVHQVNTENQGATKQVCKHKGSTKQISQNFRLALHELGCPVSLYHVIKISSLFIKISSHLSILTSFLSLYKMLLSNSAQEPLDPTWTRGRRQHLQTWRQ